MRDLAAMLDLLTQGTWRTDVLVFAVGAVYDRTTFASAWAKCAVNRPRLQRKVGFPPPVFSTKSVAGLDRKQISSEGLRLLTVPVRADPRISNRNFGARTERLTIGTRVDKAEFNAELIKGHKGVTVVLVPFDPEEGWSRKPVRLHERRHGWLIRGTANGVPFDGYIGERWG
ncbi:MAG TPA: hypothetical protein VMT78_03515, partial [Terriglobia bacterium]|nr:hypothetical protein [Terriglobia bacterium]